VGDTPLDTLMDESRGMKAQKAALAKREAEVVAEVAEVRRLEDYTGTLQKLGHAPVPHGAASHPQLLAEPAAQRAEPAPLPLSNVGPANATGRRRPPMPLPDPALAVLNPDLPRLPGQ
jgi:hypothetical protein